jgi:hypothetical protein
MSPLVASDAKIQNQVYVRIFNGEQAFRRLGKREWFSPDDIEQSLRSEVMQITDT